MIFDIGLFNNYIIKMWFLVLCFKEPMETPNPPVDNTDALNRLQIKLTENKANAQESVDRLTEKMRKDIEVGDVNFNKGLIRMTKAYLENSISVNASALHCFSKTFRENCVRGRIKVQPGAVSRRKHKNGSRQKQDNHRKNITLPHRVLTKKRGHVFNENMLNNQACPKKAGRSMISNTTYPKKKKTKN